VLHVPLSRQPRQLQLPRRQLLRQILPQRRRPSSRRPRQRHCQLPRPFRPRRRTRRHHHRSQGLMPTSVFPPWRHRFPVSPSPTLQPEPPVPAPCVGAFKTAGPQRMRPLPPRTTPDSRPSMRPPSSLRRSASTVPNTSARSCPADQRRRECVARQRPAVELRETGTGGQWAEAARPGPLPATPSAERDESTLAGQRGAIFGRIRRHQSSRRNPVPGATHRHLNHVAGRPNVFRANDRVLGELSPPAASQAGGQAGRRRHASSGVSAPADAPPVVRS
jgi:hypothetical protein